MDKVPDPPVKSDDKNLYSNLRKNLCSDLRNNLRNNPDLQTVSLISSNSYLFLYKDSKTSVVPKVATEVATSVIQIGSSYGGYREERVM